MLLSGGSSSTLSRKAQNRLFQSLQHLAEWNARTILPATSATAVAATTSSGSFEHATPPTTKDLIVVRGIQEVGIPVVAIGRRSRYEGGDAVRPEIIPAVPRPHVDDGEVYRILLRIRQLPVQDRPVLPDAVHVGQVLDALQHLVREGEGEEVPDAGNLGSGQRRGGIPVVAFRGFGTCWDGSSAWLFDLHYSYLAVCGKQ
mmetsp:Transcript_33769/g.99489  ORF Transcript_33769/g.99489 Transcript_33769/m.99489 type:complete len:201 (+) Transcript_33769:946-1548(+)